MSVKVNMVSEKMADIAGSSTFMRLLFCSFQNLQNWMYVPLNAYENKGTCGISYTCRVCIIWNTGNVHWSLTVTDKAKLKPLICACQRESLLTLLPVILAVVCHKKHISLSWLHYQGILGIFLVRPLNQVVCISVEPKQSHDFHPAVLLSWLAS